MSMGPGFVRTPVVIPTVQLLYEGSVWDCAGDGCNPDSVTQSGIIHTGNNIEQRMAPPRPTSHYRRYNAAAPIIV